MHGGMCTAHLCSRGANKIIAEASPKKAEVRKFPWNLAPLLKFILFF